MNPLPKNYDHKEAEPRLQDAWEKSGAYAWDESQPRENTFVIDTPPPTVSGVLHMGHIFSYTQADFIARYQRMKGKTVFYPMGFDDNGLPTERLVEKIRNKKAKDYSSREDFITACREEVKSAEEEFRRLFKSTALSIDWKQEYQTINDDVRKLSQMSFLDLLQKGEAYRDFRPTYWDWVDQTAIAQAEIENKEMPGVMNEIEFELSSGEKIIIATTRPELLGACVAVMYHPEDPKAKDYKDKLAITPLFGVKVPMIADELVERDKGTGLVMCCTFGDDTDKEWWKKHGLPMRPLIAEDGRLSRWKKSTVTYSAANGENINKECIVFSKGRSGSNFDANLSSSNTVNFEKTTHAYISAYSNTADSTSDNFFKIKQARERIIDLLKLETGLLKQQNIVHTVKCAERSGTPIEIIPTDQWFIRITDKKEILIKKGAECHWYPEFMHIRLNQWIEGLKEDWCISRQRFFGVPFPVWNIEKMDVRDNIYGRVFKVFPSHLLVASLDQLPIDPLTEKNKLPTGFRNITEEEKVFLSKQFSWDENFTRVACANEKILSPISSEVLFEKGDYVSIKPDKDVMDTWATSSISPQINAKSLGSSLRGAGGDEAIQSGSPRPYTLARDDRFTKLFPADLRPQAHEIIRTWAFYTIVKAHLHSDTIPWHNLMISGWCLAADKSKMSKSKGNVITPVDLIIDKGADVVRYWASTSRLGTDTAFSEDLLKIGKKLVNKLWNATSFASIHLEKLTAQPSTTAADVAGGKITETLDKWILTRLHKTIAKATQEFEKFEYCDARVAVEEFFWKDFCDNYLELVKTRAYGNGVASTSAHLTLYHCLDAILRLFAPFIPHVTEELYSHIFDGNGSIHTRGNWPDAMDYPLDEAAEESGIACVSILEAIRKAKSERKVSIKFPIKEIILSSLKEPWRTIESVANDLKSAGNVESITWSDETPPEAVHTDDGCFALLATFAENAESNSAA